MAGTYGVYEDQNGGVEIKRRGQYSNGSAYTRASTNESGLAYGGMQVIHELLLALLGFGGGIFQLSLSRSSGVENTLGTSVQNDSTTYTMRHSDEELYEVRNMKDFLLHTAISCNKKRKLRCQKVAMFRMQLVKEFFA